MLLPTESDELRYNVAQLKKQNEYLVLAIAVLAERLRQLDHSLNLGRPPERMPIGAFDLVADCDDEDRQPGSLHMTADVRETNVRIRFDNGIGKRDQR